MIFAVMIAIFSLNIQGNVAWIPLLSGFGMKEYYFGYLWSVLAFITAVSPFIATRILKKGKERKFVIGALILWAVSTAFIVFANNIVIALAIMFLAMLFYSSKGPCEEVYFHRFIPSKLRATVGSVKNMALSLAIIIALPIEGFLVDNIGAKYTILISSVLMIPAIILYSRIKERR
jgi:ACS family tartrate transporter-like MFS transporter